MHYFPSNTGYTHCRSGSDSGLHRSGSQRDVVDIFDSGDSTLSELEESESGSGSCVDVDPNLPYPGIAPIALRYLSQTTRPRSWCLALISNPLFSRGCSNKDSKGRTCVEKYSTEPVDNDAAKNILLNPTSQ